VTIARFRVRVYGNAEIFGRSQQYRKRTSSNNWHSDRVTASEEQQYRKRVGLPGITPQQQPGAKRP